MRATPDEVRLILVDLKRVELAAVRDLPHLKTPVIVEANEARAVLTNRCTRWSTATSCWPTRWSATSPPSTSARARTGKPMPYMVVVIDELADLIMREGRKVEDPIVKIAQKARAVGIHLVLATQRPQRQRGHRPDQGQRAVSRIAFAMASNVDSRTVLDAPGAEDLIGRGDMLYQPADLPRPVRLQGVFVSDAEVRAITDFWRDQAEPDYNRDLLAGADDEDGERRRPVRLAGEDGRGRDDAPRGRAGHADRQGEHVDDPDQAQGRLQPRQPAHGRAREARHHRPAGSAQPGRAAQVYGPDNWMRDHR